MPIPLIVVDMQEKFKEGSRVKRTIEEVQRQIRLAKKRKDAIIFLEFGEGDTIPEIKRLVENYDEDKVFVVKKDFSNGSHKVAAFAKKRKDLPIDRFRMCGVYTEFCVFETARGLTGYGFKVDVVRKGCNNGNTSSNKYGGWKLYKNSRIRVI